VVALVSVVFLLAPLVGLFVRAPWSDLPALLGRRTVRDALGLSLFSATAATLLSVVFGVPLAWLLARARFPGRRVLRTLVTLPVVLPPVVGGVALLLAFGRRGVIGRHFASLVTLPYTTKGVVLAETFVAMPFLVLAVEGALLGLDDDYEDAAAGLGGSPAYVFRRVTLPLVAPSVAAGAVLCWARALGEFGATVTFAGNLPGRTQTTPLAVYAALEQDPPAAIALSLVLVGVSVVVLLSLRESWLPGLRGR